MFAMMAFVSCNNEEKETGSNQQISTDIITNPSTAEDTDEEKELPEFEFESEVFDFGEISQGEKVETSFKFKNIGTTNLIITDAKGSCGCTVPSYPQHPIAPGEEGVINVVFDSNGKQGRQNKTVTLIANTQPNTKVLAIKGDIITPNK